MYDYFKGKIEFITDEYIVLENNNIGYRIYTSRYTIQDLNPNDEITTLYTKLIVKEDDMKICGFSTRTELDMYELLTSVSGVGTKVGLAILGSIDVKSLIPIIRNEDVNSLVKAPGVGKKTAQRIILELKDKVIKAFDHIQETNAPHIMVNKTDITIQEDVIQALVALGYSKKEATNAFGKVKEKINNVEDGIKHSFKHLM